MLVPGLCLNLKDSKTSQTVVLDIGPGLNLGRQGRNNVSVPQVAQSSDPENPHSVNAASLECAEVTQQLISLYDINHYGRNFVKKIIHFNLLSDQSLSLWDRMPYFSKMA